MGQSKTLHIELANGRTIELLDLDEQQYERAKIQFAKEFAAGKVKHVETKRRYRRDHEAKSDTE